jgi:hypothetical protein
VVGILLVWGRKAVRLGSNRVRKGRVEMGRGRLTDGLPEVREGTIAEGLEVKDGERRVLDEDNTANGFEEF